MDHFDGSSEFWFPNFLGCGNSEAQFMDLGCLLEILSGMIKMIINLLLLLLSVVVNLFCIFIQKCVPTFFINPWGGICAQK